MSNILSDIMTDIARLRDTITWCEGRIMKYEIAMIQLSQSRDTADLLDEKEPIEGVKIFSRGINKWLSEEDLARITGVPTARETRKDVYVDPREIPAIKVQQALITADGHVPTAAKLLDCSTPALYNKINKGKVKQYCNLDAEGRIIGSTDRNVYVPRSVPPAPAASPASQPTSSNGHTVQGAV